jgi:hypothetical protein
MTHSSETGDVLYKIRNFIPRKELNIHVQHRLNNVLNVTGIISNIKGDGWLIPACII